MIWFTSDNHYYHNNIIRYSKRPFNDVSEMNEAMIANHNALVKPEDTVYNLGDFSFADEQKSKAILNRLNGSKHLILGNHDKMIRKNPKSFMGERFFQTIQDYKEIDYNGQKIILFHFGMRVWNGSHRGSILCYGHSHNSLPPFGKSVDVGVDSTAITTEYRPISVDELLKFMKNRNTEVVDHHGMKED